MLVYYFFACFVFAFVSTWCFVTLAIVDNANFDIKARLLTLLKERSFFCVIAPLRLITKSGGPKINTKNAIAFLARV